MPMPKPRHSPRLCGVVLGDIMPFSQLLSLRCVWLIRVHLSCAALSFRLPDLSAAHVLSCKVQSEDGRLSHSRRHPSQASALLQECLAECSAKQCTRKQGLPEGEPCVFVMSLEGAKLPCCRPCSFAHIGSCKVKSCPSLSHGSTCVCATVNSSHIHLQSN